MIAIIKPYKLYPLDELNRLALKKIFEPENMTLLDERTLDKGIDAWLAKRPLKKWESTELNYIVTALIMNENGELDKRKDTFKRAKVTYKNLHRNTHSLAKKRVEKERGDVDRGAKETG